MTWHELSRGGVLVVPSTVVVFRSNKIIIFYYNNTTTYNRVGVVVVVRNRVGRWCSLVVVVVRIECINKWSNCIALSLNNKSYGMEERWCGNDN